MADMNCCSFTGRLVDDPKLEYSTGADGKTITRAGFRLAVGRRKQGETDFFNFTLWGRGAEFFTKYCGKGQRVGLSGCRAEVNEWTTREGEKRRDVRFIVGDWHFADGKRDAETAHGDAWEGEA